MYINNFKWYVFSLPDYYNKGISLIFLISYFIKNKGTYLLILLY